MGMFSDSGSEYITPYGWVWDSNSGRYVDPTGSAQMPETFQTQWGPVIPREGQQQEMGSDSAQYQRAMDLTPGEGYVPHSKPGWYDMPGFFKTADAALSYLVPAYGVASGLSKSAYGYGQGDSGLGTGGLVQAVASGYGAYSGGPTAGADKLMGAAAATPAVDPYADPYSYAPASDASGYGYQYPVTYGSGEFYDAGKQLGLTPEQTASLTDKSLGGVSANQLAGVDSTNYGKLAQQGVKALTGLMGGGGGYPATLAPTVGGTSSDLASYAKRSTPQYIQDAIRKGYLNPTFNQWLA